MKKRLIIIGAGRMAQMLITYLERDGYVIKALAVDREYLSTSAYKGYAIIPYDELLGTAPADMDMLVAIGYARMNNARKAKCDELISNGIHLLNYFSPHAHYDGVTFTGVNNIVMDNVVIEPLATIGQGNIFWPMCCISHHVTVGSYCQISSGAMVAGGATIGDGVFLGLGSSVNEDVMVAEYSLIGAGATITCDTDRYGVYVPQRCCKLDKTSDQFYR